MSTQQAMPPQPSRQGFLLGADGRVRPLWRAVLYAVTAVLLWTIVGVVLGGLAVVVWPEAAEALAERRLPPWGFLALQYAVMNAALLALAWLFLRALEERSGRALGLWFYAGWGREALVGAGIGAALIAVVVAALLAGGWVEFTGAAGRSAAALASAAVLLLLAAAFEELLMRGYAFQRLLDSIGTLGAVLVFSAIFAALHIPNPSSTPLSTANTVLAGVLLAVAYLKTRGLWLPIGLHFAWNFLLGPVLGLPVSGLEMGGLLRAEPRDPAWLSGGTYGPEGSVVLTVAAVAAIVWLWRTRTITPSAAMQEVLK